MWVMKRKNCAFFRRNYLNKFLTAAPDEPN